jgi:hypothetical protein
MERKAVITVITKVASTEEPKWTMVMAKNVHQVVSQAAKIVTNALKQEERKVNLHLTSFEAKEGETKKELVQRLNIELL